MQSIRVWYTASFFLGMLKEAETLEADRGTISTAWYSMSVGMYFYR